MFRSVQNIDIHLKNIILEWTNRMSAHGCVRSEYFRCKCFAEQQSHLACVLQTELSNSQTMLNMEKHRIFSTEIFAVFITKLVGRAGQGNMKLLLGFLVTVRLL